MLSAHRHRPRHRHSAAGPHGQSLTEFALVAPLFFMLLFGIIVIGIAVFYQQQIENSAREGARFASINTATSRCPVVSNRSPDPAVLPLPNSYSACDAPSARWPKLTAAARSLTFGMASANIQVTACWSGYWTKDTSGGWAAHDEVAVNPDGTKNAFRECTVPVYGWTPGQNPDAVASALHTINPRTELTSAGTKISVDCARQFPLTAVANDMASSFSKSDGRNANQVTVLSCYAWSPPLAGFLLIPRTLHLTGTVTESLEYQQ